MMGIIRHVCFDMQRQFAEDVPWHVPWMTIISPQVCEVVSRDAERTLFMHFMPPKPGASSRHVASML
jgi:hypothetical protein